MRFEYFLTCPRCGSKTRIEEWREYCDNCGWRYNHLENKSEDTIIPSWECE